MTGKLAMPMLIALSSIALVRPVQSLMVDPVSVPDDPATAFDFILYKSAAEAVIKALGA